MSLSQILLAIVLGVIMALNVYLYLVKRKKHEFREAFIHKFIASFSFIILGIYNIRSNFTNYTLLILLGLVMGLIGDVVICFRYKHQDQKNLYFTLGAVFFLLGHISYIIGLNLISRVNLIYFLLSFLILSFASYTFNKSGDYQVSKLTKLKITLYIMVVTIMASTAVSLFIEVKSIGLWLYSIGGVLFLLSDNLLTSYTYSKHTSSFVSRMLHASYYAAQMLIAISIIYL